MSQPFLSEIRIMSFNFAPKGWAFCNGQLLPINQNQALFALLGTVYGGDGRTTFGLPNLQGRAPLHVSQDYTLGQVGGEATHVLTSNEIQSHTHTMMGVNANADPQPGGVTPGPTLTLAQASTHSATPAQVSAYATGAPNTTMAASALGNAGQNLPHENRQPYLTMNFCIALQGIFPSRN